MRKQSANVKKFVRFSALETFTRNDRNPTKCQGVARTCFSSRSRTAASFSSARALMSSSFFFLSSSRVFISSFLATDGDDDTKEDVALVDAAVGLVLNVEVEGGGFVYDVALDGVAFIVLKKLVDDVEVFADAFLKSPRRSPSAAELVAAFGRTGAVPKPMRSSKSDDGPRDALCGGGVDFFGGSLNMPKRSPSCTLLGFIGFVDLVCVP